MDQYLSRMTHVGTRGLPDLPPITSFPRRPLRTTRNACWALSTVVAVMTLLSASGTMAAQPADAPAAANVSKQPRSAFAPTLGVAFGDTIAKVKQVYETEEEPEPTYA